jgi:hypothetical protein
MPDRVVRGRSPADRAAARRKGVIPSRPGEHLHARPALEGNPPGQSERAFQPLRSPAIDCTYER